MKTRKIWQNIKKISKKYARQRISKCPSQLNSGSRDDSSTLIINLDLTYENCELVHLKRLQANVSEILNVKEEVLQLRQIKEGSVSACI